MSAKAKEHQRRKREKRIRAGRAWIERSTISESVGRSCNVKFTLQKK